MLQARFPKKGTEIWLRKKSFAAHVERRRAYVEDDGKGQAGAAKIAKALKRSPGATTVMAAKRGVSLSTRG
jgi:hypothetical protein